MVPLYVLFALPFSILFYYNISWNTILRKSNLYSSSMLILFTGCVHQISSVHLESWRCVTVYHHLPFNPTACAMHTPYLYRMTRQPNPIRKSSCIANAAYRTVKKTITWAQWLNVTNVKAGSTNCVRTFQQQCLEIQSATGCVLIV